MTSQELLKKDLPDLPGVYIFRDPTKNILYIGKATSLRDRTRSYFATDLIHTRGSRLVDMVTLATDIDYIVTDSVLEALILEAHLIQKYQPKYNSAGKDDKSWNYVVITKEDFPKVLVERGRTVDAVFPKKKIKYLFGPFPHGAQLRTAMKIIRKIFPYSDASCTPAEFWTRQGKPEKIHPCWNYQIGLCPGVCMGTISKKDYARTINHLRLFFEGKKSELVKQLEREMKQSAKAFKFEDAEMIKHTIFAINHIQDISLIKEEATLQKEEDQLNRKESGENRIIFRTEAYDIAHISGTSQVGVMVVLEDGEPAKSEYRKFKIRTQRGSNDIGSLKEVLRRRFNHPEWQLPSLIVVDGGQAQINAAKEILAERELDIDIVSVVKDARHKPRDVMGSETFSQSEEYKKTIILANSEAHRFAITYHRRLRGRLK